MVLRTMLQNRVTPQSELVADPARGLVYGNRGCLHDADGRIRRRYNGKRWIACRLEFKGWHRAPLHEAAFDELPDGTFVLEGGEPWLVLGDRLLHWTAAGYDARRVRPRGRAILLTPPTLVEILRSGWEPLVPLLHPSRLHV